MGSEDSYFTVRESKVCSLNCGSVNQAGYKAVPVQGGQENLIHTRQYTQRTGIVGVKYSQVLMNHTEVGSRHHGLGKNRGSSHSCFRLVTKALLGT